MATQQEIAQNYQNLFGRAPDPEGAAYWASTGLSGQSLVNAMLGGAQGKDVTYAQQHPYSPVIESNPLSTSTNDVMQKGLAATTPSSSGTATGTGTRFTDAQIASYIKDQNVTTPAQIAQMQQVFGVDASQLSRAQQLIANNDPSVQAAHNAYAQQVAANPNVQSQNLAYYNPQTGTGTALNNNLTNNSTATTPSFTFNFGNPSVGTTSTASGLDTSNPYVQAAEKTVAGNIAGAQAATAANRVNQVTPYGNLQYQQTGTDAQGNPIWSATQSLAPELQGAFGNIAGQVTQNTAQGFNPNLPSVGINPGETYEAAIMRRLQPQQERQAKALEVQLANQGIMPGSEAYTRAKTELSQAQNDQLTSAVVGGFQTGLAANQSAYNQALSNYQLPLATMNQFKAATTPSYVNPYQQAAVSGPDYLGAYTTGQNAQLAQQAAQNAASSGMTSGLFNLAGTAIANPSAVSSAYNWAKGLFS